MNSRKVFCLICLAFAGCGDQADDLTTPVELTGQPVALDSQLVFISGGSREAFLLDVTQKRLSGEAKRAALPYGAIKAERRLGTHDEALVVCSGRRGSAEADAEPSTLAMIDGRGRVQRYELGDAAFDTLVQSEDGRYAVLYNSGTNTGRTLRNVNELVVVDLERDPRDTRAVTSKTPEGLAHEFDRAVISPELPIAGESRRLLLLLSAAEITLFDLNHLDRRGTIVELGEGQGRMPKPTQVLFGTDEPVLYVRGENANDVFVFRLEPRSSDAGLNDFRPTLNPLGAGVSPRDMALFGAEDSPQVLVVGRSSEARSIDPRSGKTLVTPLPGAADHIRLFEGTSPKDSQVRTRALVYADGGTSLMFVDLEGMRDRPDRAVEPLELSAAVTSVIDIGRPNALIITHAKGITLVDLEQRTATPIAAKDALEGALFDGPTQHLWVATQQQPWVATFDLQSGETGEVPLDATVKHLVPFFEAGKLAIVHPSDIGYVTVIDTENPSRDSARSVRGFLVAGLLDRGDE